MADRSITPAHESGKLAPVSKSSEISSFLAFHQAKIQRSLDAALPLEKFMQVAMTVIRGNWKLEHSTLDSLLTSLLQAAEVQLFPGNTLGHAYLVPFKSGFLSEQAGRDVFECTYIMGYKGMLALCHRSKKVLKVEAHTVHKGDEFSIAYGEGGGLVHKPDPWGARAVDNCLGAYAIAVLANGEKLFEPMSKAELEAIRKRSKAKNDGPWVTDTLEMYRKTTVRRLAKYLPLEPLDAQAIAEDEARELGFAAPREVEHEDVDPAAEFNAQVEAAQADDEPDPVHSPDDDRPTDEEAREAADLFDMRGDVR